MESSTHKFTGAIYTPKFIVDEMLNFCEYKENIQQKHVIDNSCGDGAFLLEVVRRYICEFQVSNKGKERLRTELETYIHGIEIDGFAVAECKRNLDLLAKEFGLADVNWDICCGDALFIDKYDGKMDFVVGNPPYVRVHNLRGSYESVKKFSFSVNGMTDLYIVFFELGFRMLSPSGKMVLITPSSFLRSNAGSILRKFIMSKKNLKAVIDLGHFQPFQATTYTIISFFSNVTRSEFVKYWVFDQQSKEPRFIEELSYDDISISGKIYFSRKSELQLLRKIDEYYIGRTSKTIVVKNGFATLADNIFIGDFPFKGLVIDVLKASTGIWTKAIFPYHDDGTPFIESELLAYPDAYSYLLSKKDILKLRDIDSQAWFLYGRSQAIRDVYMNKIAVNTTLKDPSSIKIQTVGPGCGVYSGLYILTRRGEDEIRDVLGTEEFFLYLGTLKNYKSGGYYSISTIELEKFLRYKLEVSTYGQLRILESRGEFISDISPHKLEVK